MKWFESIIDPMSGDITHNNTILFSNKKWLRGRSLNDVLNQRYLNQEGYAMICLEEYGQGNLFMLVDLKKSRAYEKSYQDISPRVPVRDPYSNYDWVENQVMRELDPNFKEPTPMERQLQMNGEYFRNDPISFFEYLIPDDTPCREGTNLHSTFIGHYKALSFEHAITMRGHAQVLKGLTSFYQKNFCKLKAGCGVASGYVFGNSPSDGEMYDEDPPVEMEPSLSIDREIPFDEFVPSFENDAMPNMKYSYCVIGTDGNYKFTDKVGTEDMHGLFIYLPTFGLWQYLTISQLHVLMYTASVKISYAKVEDPEGMTGISTLSEFQADDLISILETAVALGADIGMQKKFTRPISSQDQNQTDPAKNGPPYPIPKKLYDAISFVIDLESEWTVRTTLTQAELGIMPRSEYERYNWKYSDPTRINIPSQLTTSYMTRKKFWLLGIILQLANLRPDWGNDRWGV